MFLPEIDVTFIAQTGLKNLNWILLYKKKNFINISGLQVVILQKRIMRAGKT